MAKALTAPPDLVGCVHEGSYGLLAAAAEAIVVSAHPHEPCTPMSRRKLEHAWALLGGLGWTSNEDNEEAIELAPEQSTTLRAAIETMVPLPAKWLGERDPDDASRPDRADELRLVRQFAVRLEGEPGGYQ